MKKGNGNRLSITEVAERAFEIYATAIEHAGYDADFGYSDPTYFHDRADERVAELCRLNGHTLGAVQEEMDRQSYAEYAEELRAAGYNI
jgi:hypothetical protein